jgi:hypothetical protein
MRAEIGKFPLSTALLQPFGASRAGHEKVVPASEILSNFQPGGDVIRPLRAFLGSVAKSLFVIIST